MCLFAFSRSRTEFVADFPSAKQNAGRGAITPIGDYVLKSARREFGDGEDAAG